MHLRIFWLLLKRAFADWNANNGWLYGSALAYYSVFAIAPLLIIVVGVAGLIFGKEAAQRNIVGDLENTVGQPVAKAAQEMLANNADTGGNTLATIVGVAILLVGAMGVFSQLQEALNVVWKVAPKPSVNIWSLLRDRFISLTMVLGTGFLLLVSLLVHTALAAASVRLSTILPGGAGVWEAINMVVSFAVVTVLFALIFKYVPDANTSWKDVGVGALLTSALFALGKFLLGWYLGRASTTSAFGAAASLVVILLWVYYASQVLLFGAAFTRAYALRLGTGVEPSSIAMSTEPADPSAKPSLHH